jgi:hypothetical protein
MWLFVLALFGMFTVFHIANGEHVPFFYWIFIGLALWRIANNYAAEEAAKNQSEAAKHYVDGYFAGRRSDNVAGSSTTKSM